MHRSKYTLICNPTTMDVKAVLSCNIVSLLGSGFEEVVFRREGKHGVGTQTVNTAVKPQMLAPGHSGHQLHTSKHNRRNSV